MYTLENAKRDIALTVSWGFGFCPISVIYKIQSDSIMLFTKKSFIDVDLETHEVRGSHTPEEIDILLDEFRNSQHKFVLTFNGILDKNCYIDTAEELLFCVNDFLVKYNVIIN